jgi:hypothetical protein
VDLRSRKSTHTFFSIESSVIVRWILNPDDNTTQNTIVLLLDLGSNNYHHFSEENHIFLPIVFSQSGDPPILPILEGERKRFQEYFHLFLIFSTNNGSTFPFLIEFFLTRFSIFYNFFAIYTYLGSITASPNIVVHSNNNTINGGLIKYLLISYLNKSCLSQ